MASANVQSIHQSERTVSRRRAVVPDAVRVLELRCADGAGGGPEKTILAGARPGLDRTVRVHVCYIRSAKDRQFSVGTRCRAAGLHYAEMAERWPVDPGVFRQLARLIRRRRIEIVHSHDYKSDLYALTLAKWTGVTPLATAHGWTGQTTRERLLYYPLNKRMLRWFPQVIAVSSEIKTELLRWGVCADNISVLLNGIDPTIFRRQHDGERRRQLFGIESGRVVLGAVGRLEPQKRFDLLLQAMAGLCQRPNELLLLIAGEGSERQRLEQQVVELGLQRQCRFLGQVSAIKELYHCMDLFVQSSEYEGTANVLLEAMALEVPIIATSAGGTEELLSDGIHGTIVPPGSPMALATAIAAALADPAATRQRAVAARRRVEQELSFERRVAKLHALYHQLRRSALTNRR